ncbi:MAG: DUF3127 domain-containing protein [Bacteroidales bacterium]
MELTGQITHINPIVSGESKNGSWKKQDFVILTDAQYPKNVCFSLWGDKISKLESAVGDKVNVSFDLESRESNGRWFTEARAWMVKKMQQSVVTNDNDGITTFVDEGLRSENIEDDLPF